MGFFSISVTNPKFSGLIKILQPAGSGQRLPANVLTVTPTVAEIEEGEIPEKPESQTPKTSVGKIPEIPEEAKIPEIPEGEIPATPEGKRLEVSEDKIPEIPVEVEGKLPEIPDEGKIAATPEGEIPATPECEILEKPKSLEDIDFVPTVLGNPTDVPDMVAVLVAIMVICNFLVLFGRCT